MLRFTESLAWNRLFVWNTSDIITIDPEVLGGEPVFKGTRVLVKTLFENDYLLEEFLACFPSVTRDLARQVLECSEQALLSPAAAMKILLDECVPSPIQSLLTNHACNTAQSKE